MSSMFDKRRTQIDFNAVKALPSSPHNTAPEKADVVDAEMSRTPVLGPVAEHRRAWSSEGFHTNATALKRHAPTALRSNRKSIEFVKAGSPWEKYKKSHDLRLGEKDEDMVVVAEVRHPWSDDLVLPAEKSGPTPYVVTVRSFLVDGGERKCRTLQRIEHENIVSVREIFRYEGLFYAVFEHLPMSLSLLAGLRNTLTRIN